MLHGVSGKVERDHYLATITVHGANLTSRSAFPPINML
jgi:hypothetical protein